MPGGRQRSGLPPTEAEIGEYVRRIGAFCRDPERALGMEHQLYTAVLAAIAMGAPDPAQLAAAALQSQAYEFERFAL